MQFNVDGRQKQHLASAKSCTSEHGMICRQFLSRCGCIPSHGGIGTVVGCSKANVIIATGHRPWHGSLHGPSNRGSAANGTAKAGSQCGREHLV